MLHRVIYSYIWWFLQNKIYVYNPLYIICLHMFILNKILIQLDLKKKVFFTHSLSWSWKSDQMTYTGRGHKVIWRSKRWKGLLALLVTQDTFGYESMFFDKLGQKKERPRMSSAATGYCYSCGPIQFSVSHCVRRIAY